MIPEPVCPIPEPLAVALARASRVVALTGAGVSAESGVPTFRDARTGLWAKFDPLELATPRAFARRPGVVWDWYAERRAAVARANPNPGHYALVVLEARAPSFLLVTQNVDGLHQRAGSQAIVELHGSLARVRCSREDRLVAAWDEPDPGLPPRCPHCGAFLRPDVVWFDEPLPPAAIARAETAARACDLMIVAGTSAEVHPAATLPWLAREAGATVVEINPATTPLTQFADHALRARSGVALPAWVARAWPDSVDIGADGGGAK